MSADIFLAKDLVYSTKTLGFNDVLQRIRCCCDADARVIGILDYSEAVSCLDIERQENPTIKIKLLRGLQTAARRILSELSSNPKSCPGDIAAIERLIDLSKEALARVDEDFESPV